MTKACSAQLLKNHKGSALGVHSLKKANIVNFYAMTSSSPSFTDAVTQHKYFDGSCDFGNQS